MSTLDRMADYYVECFWSEQGTVAREYMLGRGFNEETLRAFNVGFAPSAWNAPMDDEDMKFLQSVGHIHEDTGRDFFDGRVMFPIQDERGNVKGFCGRLTHDKKTSSPKYKVSPETYFFRKGDYLYGLSQNRERIFKEDKGLLVEGFTDVLAYWQTGTPVAVCIMGVKMTEEQITLLAKYTSHVFMSLDPDAGGNPATVKIHNKLQESGFAVRRINLPAGVDPAKLLLGH